MEIQQGAVLKVEKIKDPVFVASKNFFNQSGEIIGCPILGESTESPLHIYVEMDENKGYIQCEQMKMLDLRVRGYKIIDRVKMADVINVNRRNTEYIRLYINAGNQSGTLHS